MWFLPGFVLIAVTRLFALDLSWGVLLAGALLILLVAAAGSPSTTDAEFKLPSPPRRPSP